MRNNWIFNMLTKKRRWCLNGCGKRVAYDFGTRKFICSVCDAVFTKKELEEWKKR